MTAILSLDMAFRNLGCVVYVDGKPVHAKTIKTEKSAFKSTHRLVSNQDLNSLIYSNEELKKIIDKYDVDTIYCELSTAGGKSASAVKGLAYSFMFLVAPLVFGGVKNYLTCTPNDVKKFVYKKTSGDKEGIMKFVGDLHNLKTKGSGRTLKYEFCGEWFGKGAFEHIADAVIVYEHITGTKR